MPDTDDASYSGNTRRADPPSGLLPSDDYTRQLQRLRGVTSVSKGTVETESPYGQTQTWLVETHRLRDSGGEWMFLQRIGQGPVGPEALRQVFPPEVMALVNRQHAALTDKARTAGARQAMATRKAAGFDPGAALLNPAVRAKALKARKAKAAKRKARRAKARV